MGVAKNVFNKIISLDGESLGAIIIESSSAFTKMFVKDFIFLR